MKKFKTFMEEGKNMDWLHKLINQGKSAEYIARTMELDRDTVEALMEKIQKMDEGTKAEYQAFVKAKMKKFGVKSPSELKGADKKKFYDELDAEWESDDEEDGIEEWKSEKGNRRCSGGDGRKQSAKVKKAEDCGPGHYEDEEEEE